MEVSDFGSNYLRLGLRIGKHINNYVDYYYGPPRIKALVDNEPKRSAKDLLNDCTSLQNGLSKQGFDAKREKYLEKMLKAIKVTIETELLGIKKPVIEVFELLADMELRPIKESKLNDLKAQFNEAYGGAGTLSERMARMRKKRTIPENNVLKAFEKALDIVKRKTQELFPGMLPKKESIDLEAASSNGNVKWAAYDWYKGNFKSVVEVNTKYSTFWTVFLLNAAHEGYPGHHTEFAVAEDKLYRKENQFERAILLYNTPYMIICEGIADIGLNALFSYREQVEIALREFCPDSKNGPSVEELAQQNSVRKKYNMFGFNAAYHKLVDRWSDEEVFEYLDSFEILGTEACNIAIKLMNSPIFKMTSFSHQLGRDLIVNKFGEFPPPKDFRYLLENPVLPSDLV